MQPPNDLLVTRRGMMNDLVWRKSKACANQACVEVAQTKALTLVRDSKLTDSPILTFDNDAWQTFVASLK